MRRLAFLIVRDYDLGPLREILDVVELEVISKNKNGKCSFG
jgi:hypothetical protein